MFYRQPDTDYSNYGRTCSRASVRNYPVLSISALFSSSELKCYYFQSAVSSQLDFLA